jgi:hypothetical protein
VTNPSGINRAINRLKYTWPFSLLHGAMSPAAKARLRHAVDRASEPSKADRLIAQAGQTNDLLSTLLYELARQSPRAQDPSRLLAHGFKVYSQHDEDGIIEEIFRRIGETDRFFVEFGVGDGQENCTVYCLLKGWRGAWIDGSAACYEAIRRDFAGLMAEDRLRVKYSFITAENIEQLFAELRIPVEFDLLSIDIDYNDYWVWDAIRAYRPRVVAVEYNASFGGTANCVVPYEPSRIWDYTNHFGASLKALEFLGRAKGYTLVGCNYTGVTCFFVRDDLVGSHFPGPHTSEHHFERPRFFVRMPNGHRAAFGPTVAAPDPGRRDGA